MSSRKVYTFVISVLLAFSVSFSAAQFIPTTEFLSNVSYASGASTGVYYINDGKYYQDQAYTTIFTGYADGLRIGNNGKPYTSKNFNDGKTFHWKKGRLVVFSRKVNGVKYYRNYTGFKDSKRYFKDGLLNVLYGTSHF